MPHRIILVLVSVVFLALVSTAQARKATSSLASGQSQRPSVGVSERKVPISSLTEAERLQMQRHPLSNPQVVQISGERVGLGCRYRLGLYLAPDERAKQIDEVSSDLATCTMIAQRGVPTRFSHGASKGGSLATRELRPRPDQCVRPQESPSPACGGGANRAAGYHHAWYDDPFSADVTSIKNHIDWTYLNGTIQSILSCQLEAWWRSGTDWRLTGGPSGQCFTAWDGAYAYLNGEVYYANLYFCDPTAWTYNSYRYNWVRGDGAGGLFGWADAWKSGDCESLLQFHTNLVRTI